MAKLPADFVCTYKGCGRKGGRARLKIEKRKIPKTNKKLVTTTTDFRTDQKETKHIEKTHHLHPLKYLTVFGVLHPDEKPVINLPKSNVSGENTESYRALKRGIKVYEIFRRMLPWILHEFPFIEKIVRECIYSQYVYFKNWESAADDRWRRSLSEWELIIKYVKDNTPKEASRKYSGVMPDGEYKYLSPDYINQKTPEVEAYWNTRKHYDHILVTRTKFIRDTISIDPQLMDIYNRYAAWYDNYEARKQQEQQSQERKTDNNNTAFYKYKLNRRRWVVTHYNPELYKQQKLQGKGEKANGRIEHRVKKTDLPPETVKEEEQRRGNNGSI